MSDIPEMRVGWRRVIWPNVKFGTNNDLSNQGRFKKQCLFLVGDGMIPSVFMIFMGVMAQVEPITWMVQSISPDDALDWLAIPHCELVSCGLTLVHMGSTDVDLSISIIHNIQQHPQAFYSFPHVHLVTFSWPGNRKRCRACYSECWKSTGQFTLGQRFASVCTFKLRDHEHIRSGVRKL